MYAFVIYCLLCSKATSVLFDRETAVGVEFTFPTQSLTLPNSVTQPNIFYFNLIFSIFQ